VRLPNYRSVAVKQRVYLFAIVALFALVTLGCSIGRYKYQGVSMEPTLSDEDFVFTDDAAYSKSLPQRGDLVILTRENGLQLIKRVVGLPGEEISISNGQVIINGTPLDEPYAREPIRSDVPSKQIPADHYFVLGDNRNNSSDSRAFGPVPLENIQGQVWFIYWPMQKLGPIAQPTYPTK
jgi:signal peptidase I